MLDCKALSLKLEGKRDDILSNSNVIQRCVSYFRSIHSTSMLEGLGYRVINSFETSNICGNKLFAHVTLRKNGVKTPRAIADFLRRVCFVSNRGNRISCSHKTYCGKLGEIDRIIT